MNPILAQARAFCQTVVDFAETFNLNVTALAVDKGGHLIALQRTDRAGFPSAEAARRKATAAATIAMPTAAMVHMFEKDQLVVTALHASGDMLIVPGGFPMIVDKVCVGGFGIAGGHYSEDVMLGERALEALAARRQSVEGP
jgi:uncharacterized protein GlcG (DUF336 family)